MYYIYIYIYIYTYTHLYVYNNHQTLYTPIYYILNNLRFRIRKTSTIIQPHMWLATSFRLKLWKCRPPAADVSTPASHGQHPLRKTRRVQIMRVNSLKEHSTYKCSTLKYKFAICCKLSCLSLQMRVLLRAWVNVIFWRTAKLSKKRLFKILFWLRIPKTLHW